MTSRKMSSDAVIPVRTICAPARLPIPEPFLNFHLLFCFLFPFLFSSLSPWGYSFAMLGIPWPQYIDPRFIKVKFARSSGPGGQHVNKTESKVDMRECFRLTLQLNPHVANNSGPLFATTQYRLETTNETPFSPCHRSVFLGCGRLMPTPHAMLSGIDLNQLELPPEVHERLFALQAGRINKDNELVSERNTP